MTDAANAPADNVAVLLTAPGAAAIAVVRLSGPATAAFAVAHLSRSPRVGRCVHCDLHDDGTVLDDVLAVAVSDHVLDLNVHGGPYVVRATLDLLARSGVRIADAADVPDLAHDAADRIERQALADLPRVRTRPAARLLLAQPLAWARMIDAADRDAMTAALRDQTLAHLLDPPTVALAGRPNVGKSTLANALFGRTRSITSPAAGTTRDWVGDEADVGGLLVRLVDTPGLRDTADPIEAAAQAAAGPVVAAADLVLVLFDADTPDPTARGLLAAHPAAVAVRTKLDLGHGVNPDSGVIDVSASRGDGVDHLRAVLRQHFDCQDLSPRPLCWTPDQRDAVRSALAVLSEGPASASARLAAFLRSGGVYNRPTPPVRA